MTEITADMMAAGVAAFNEYRSAPLGIGPSDVAGSIFKAMDAARPTLVEEAVAEVESLAERAEHALAEVFGAGDPPVTEPPTTEAPMTTEAATE